MSRTLAFAVTATALIACLTGCSDGSESTIAPAAQDSRPAAAGKPATAGQPEPELRASIEAQLGFPPKPDAQTTQAYLTDLKGIDPSLVSAGDPDTLVNRGRDQCRDIKARPEREWTSAANQRFTTPQAPAGLGDDTATKIIKVVRARLCPSF
jgi:hypothetical protein